MVGVGFEPTCQAFQTCANPPQLSDLEMERAVRLELTSTGFAIRRLSHLATRANLNWSIVPDSNRCLSDGNAVSLTDWTNDANRIGAPGETRTHNPLLKRQVPSSNLATDACTMVRVERFELVTRLILSQPPLPIGLHAQSIWYSRRDSNPH